jgi:two-component system response regulator AlgR
VTAVNALTGGTATPDRPAMKLLLVDDEALARLRLRSLVEGLATATPPLRAEVVGEAGDAPTALALLRNVAVDAVLLDIRMPGEGGLQLASRLRQMQTPPAVIFVTAHTEHALKAFELEAIDYLTKPVRRERLQAALQRVEQRLHALRPREFSGAGAPAPPPEPVLVVTDRGRTLRIPLSEVLVLKAELKYVTLRTADHSHVLDESLSELELRLNELGGDFLRVHRNALVARRAIRELELHSDEVDGWAVRVAPLDEWLAVSRRQVAAVRSALQQLPS